MSAETHFGAKNIEDIMNDYKTKQEEAEQAEDMSNTVFENTIVRYDDCIEQKKSGIIQKSN